MIRHKLFVHGPKWAMRDSRPHAFESMKTGVLHVLENTVGPKVGPFLTLSQIVACLIERWDSMSDEEKLAVQLCIDGDAVVESIVAVAPDTA